MTETERVARLLCRADDRDPDEPMCGGTWLRWQAYVLHANKLHAAGLTVLPIEPDDATVDEMAREAYSESAAIRLRNTVLRNAQMAYALERREASEQWADKKRPMDRDLWRSIARAAYRAAVKGKA